LVVYVNMKKINNNCIWCGLCQTFSDVLFSVQGIPAVVVKQPETPEEQATYEQAKAACPVQAIE